MKYLLIIAIIFLFFYFSEYNTKKMGGFYVHRTSDHKSLETLQEIDKRINILILYLKQKYKNKTCVYKFDMNKRTNQLIRNYDKNALREISPLNISNHTSFTEGKGQRVVLCLRSVSGEIHDINTIMFVVLHEMAHVMNEEWGHGEGFWKLFQIVLIDAAECNIYTPINYRKYPQNYCGMVIDQSPLFN